MTHRWVIGPKLKESEWQQVEIRHQAPYPLCPIFWVSFIPLDLWIAHFSPSSLQNSGQTPWSLAGRSAAAPLLDLAHQCCCYLPHLPSSTTGEKIIKLMVSHYWSQLSDFLLQEQNLDSSFRSSGPMIHSLPRYTSHIGHRASTLVFPSYRTFLHFTPLIPQQQCCFFRKVLPDPSALLQPCFFPSQYIFHFVIIHLKWWALASPPLNCELQEGRDPIWFAHQGAGRAGTVPGSQ